MKYLVIILIIVTTSVYADTRFCGEPERYSNGVIKRSKMVVEQFERLYPLPTKFKRSDFEVNHVVPLVCGGCDTIENMIWMTKLSKSCSDWYCQDRHEQLTMCPQSFHK